MKKNVLIIGMASTIVIGVAIYLIRRNRLERQQLLHVSDAGYETAHDVLFPLKRKRWKKY
jgi:hypothetical protein